MGFFILYVQFCSQRMRSLIDMSDSKNAREREDSKARIGFTISSFSLSLSLIQHQLDQLIANDCPYCGMKMIRSISIPLLPIDELNKLIDSWK